MLADINNDQQSGIMADGRAEGKLVFRRPYCDEFLDFCAQNFEVAIWSSRNKNNVELVVDIVMKDFKPCLLFCWTHLNAQKLGIIHWIIGKNL